MDDQPAWPDGGRIVQRSLYDPQENTARQHSTIARRGSEPYQIAPQENKQLKSGIVHILVFK